MSLNEQLAELCGALKGGSVEYSLATGVPRRRATYAIKGQIFDQSDWNPTADLNQLRMCYEAAEKDCKKSVPKDAFASDFIDALVEVWIDIADHVPTDREIATAWVTRPKFVAQAILKAKGVS